MTSGISSSIPSRPKAGAISSTGAGFCLIITKGLSGSGLFSAGGMWKSGRSRPEWKVRETVREKENE